jgi:flagellar motor switch protein FliM
VSPRKQSDGPAVELLAHLAESQIHTSELADLRAGDVIDTESGPGADICIRVDGIGTFAGQLGAVAGRKAVRIRKRVDPQVGQDASG